jgi:PAS domain S-box-containing protein
MNKANGQEGTPVTGGAKIFQSLLRLERLAWLPVPAYIALIAILSMALPQYLAVSLVFDPPVLMLVLNTVFLFGISFAVCTVAMRAYLASGSSSILLLGCGVLSLGGAALAGGWVRPLGGGANTSVTIHNLGVLLGGILFSMSALVTFVKTEPEQIMERRRQKLLIGLGGTLVLIAIIIVATIRGVVPLFWAVGTGSTLIKQAVLGTAVALFALTSMYTMVLYFQNRRYLFYWYSLALALTAIGLIGITVMKAVGDPIGWAGRTAQYFGGVYFLMATLSALRDAQRQGLTLETAIDRFYRRSEVHYRDLVDTVSDAIISIDDGRRVLLWNRGAEVMLGYSAGETAGRLVGELLVGEGDKEKFEDEVQVLQKQITKPFASKKFEIEFRSKDGSMLPSETSLSMRRIGSGWTATLVARDITERRRVEEALKEAHERAIWLARFPEQNPNPIIRVSADGTVLYCNPASAKFQGWTCEIGQLLRNQLFPLVSRALAEGKEVQQDVLLDERFYMIWIVPFPEERYANVYGRDITLRKQAEDELKKAHDKLEIRVQERTVDLEKANEALRHLSSRLLSAQEEERKRIAGEIHDSLGSCLSGIKFKVEKTLQEIEKTPHATGESLNAVIPVIQEGIEECRRMQQDLRPSLLDDLGLLATLSWYCRRYQTIYTGIKVELEQTLEERDIPNALKIVIFRVTQEGMNNIAKHSKADLVHLSLRKMDGRIELVLKDNGQGFNLKKVLDSESTKRGLGLTSMKERTEISGGSFAIESTEGKGTTVRASWPLGEDA